MTVTVANRCDWVWTVLRKSGRCTTRNWRRKRSDLRQWDRQVKMSTNSDIRLVTFLFADVLLTVSCLQDKVIAESAMMLPESRNRLIEAHSVLKNLIQVSVIRLQTNVTAFTWMTGGRTIVGWWRRFQKCIIASHSGSSGGAVILFQLFCSIEEVMITRSSQRL